MTEIQLLKNLEVPKGVVDAVIDTDTFNEVDDQYAVAYMLRSPERINTVAIYAAPFFNRNSTSPEDGMYKSYDEAKKIVKLCGRDDMLDKIYKGSTRYLPDEKTAVDSDAARDLVERARNYTTEKPLYVIAIGAITNVASALILDPTIAEKIVIVWLGGHALHWDNNAEFNLKQDVAAARIVFGGTVPFVQLPCCGVVSAFNITEPELEKYFIDKNPLADYLAKNTIQDERKYKDGLPWARVIWDVTAVAWLLNDDQRFMNERIMHAPIPEYDHKYAMSNDTKFMKYIWNINRATLWNDVINKLCK